MKILVLVKEIVDRESKLVLINERTIDDRDSRFAINPYDEFAIEEALRIKEKTGGEVVVISLGRAEAEGTIRDALALGVDRARLICSPRRDALTISTLLAENIMHEGNYDLILSGWISADANQAQIPGRVSAILGIPFINVVTQIEIAGRTALCHKQADGLLAKVEVTMPAVVTVEKGINEPRFPTVMNIIQAGKAPLQKFYPDQSQSPEEMVTYEIPSRRRPGIIMNGDNSDEAVSFLVRAIISEKLL